MSFLSALAAAHSKLAIGQFIDDQEMITEARVAIALACYEYH